MYSTINYKLFDKHIMNGKIHLLKKYLAKGLRINEYYYDWECLRNILPINQAIYYNQNDVVRFFVDECGANVNAEYDFCPLLHALRYNFEMVQYLIDHGAIYNTDSNFEVYFPFIIERSEIDSLKFLVENGYLSDINAHYLDKPFFFSALDSSNMDKIRYFFENGLNIITAIGRDGATALTYYAKYQAFKTNYNPEVIPYLIINGVDPKIGYREDNNMIYTDYLTEGQKQEVNVNLRRVKINNIMGNINNQ